MKRFMDILGSMAGLLIVWPVALLVALAVKISSPGPALFHQERMGRHGSKFHIVKFRTMAVQKSCSGCQVTAGGDSRITSVGAFLRRHKLDELPQLINVLRGEMSFVGPRPEVPEFAELFPMEYAQILKVRPGITHPATLNFRREEEILAEVGDPRKFYIDKVMPEKLAAYEADLEQSLAQDIKTIVETILPGLGEEPLTVGHFIVQPTLTTVTMPEPVIVANVPVYAGIAADHYAAAPKIRKEEEFAPAAAVGV